jgi:hypothetical protein
MTEQEINFLTMKSTPNTAMLISEKESAVSYPQHCKENWN